MSGGPTSRRRPSRPPPEGLRLDELAREIPGVVDVVGDPTTRVYGVHHDSRAVLPGDLFVARKGAESDGLKYVQNARAAGARAVLAARGTLDAEAVAAVGLPMLLVDDVLAGLAFASAAVCGHPAFSLEIVGITGTNGKTTTTHLVRAAIDGIFGRPRCAILGTVGHVFGDHAVAAAHTTPEADEIARLLAAFRADGATHVAMEVSSIALMLGRVLAVRFRVAAFTNLTQDHLDFHGSMNEYADAKARLFTSASPGAAVINVGDPAGAEIARRVRAPLVRVTTAVGAPAADADIAPIRASFSARGIQATLRTPVGEVALTSRLVGAHNLENLVVALGIVHALELNIARAVEVLRDEPGAPGRLERCDEDGDDITVLVDYAHTPDALDKVLASVRAVSAHGSQIVCVVGCGGDRDASKRGPMGEGAARGADVVVVTNDNPRTEDPVVIARAVEEGARRGGAVASTVEALAAIGRGGKRYLVELDRARAIALAVATARPGDVVLIAGKGHEDYQIVGKEKRPFDDRIEARRALAMRRGAEAQS